MADAQEFQVRMARATDEDIEAVREFLDCMEEQAENFVPDAFGLVQRYNEAAASFERIILGYQILRDSLCDPNLSYLDVRPEIKALEAAAKGEDCGQIKAEMAAVLQAVAKGDKRYRYTSPFLTDMVRWDVVREDLNAILDRHMNQVEMAKQEAAAKV